MNFPDWTHSNAVLYSASDGDLVLSMRHQNWILKIDYNNGQGAGDIVWHLGEGGDFTLQNGNDPVDWFYAQHKPSFVTPNTFAAAAPDSNTRPSESRRGFIRCSI